MTLTDSGKEKFSQWTELEAAHLVIFFLCVCKNKYSTEIICHRKDTKQQSDNGPLSQ